MIDKQKVYYNSDEAATFKEGLSGWVTNAGRFWGKDEHMARWDGCTHLKCDCGEEYEKGWNCCAKCRSRKGKERYEAKPFKEYDGNPVFSEACDEYFFSECDIEDHCDAHEIEYKDLMLVICEPQYMRQLEDDLWCDDLPDDHYLYDVVPEIWEKIEEVNQMISKQKPILSWMAGKFRTEYKATRIASELEV